MKITLSIAFLALFLTPFMTQAQSAAIDAALQKGNASELSPYMAKSVDVSIMGNESTVTSTEAVNMLAEFFIKTGVKGYKPSHNTAAQSGSSKNTIGDLSTGQGAYRLSLFYDSAGKISEVRIEK